MKTLIRRLIMWHHVAADLGLHCLPVACFMGFPTKNGLNLKIVQFANRVVCPAEVDHHEPSYLDLHCLPNQPLNSQYDCFDKTFFEICRHKFCCLYFWSFKG